MLSDHCAVLSVCPFCDVGVMWPNGWMDQDETRYACRPRPWPHCVRWGPSSPSHKGHSPSIFGPYLLWPNGWWIKMPLNREVGLSPSDILLDGDPAPPFQKGGTDPPYPTPKYILGPCLLWPNGWRDQSVTWYRDRPRPRRHCVKWGSGSPLKVSK